MPGPQETLINVSCFIIQDRDKIMNTWLHGLPLSPPASKERVPLLVKLAPQFSFAKFESSGCENIHQETFKLYFSGEILHSQKELGVRCGGFGEEGWLCLQTVHDSSKGTEKPFRNETAMWRERGFKQLQCVIELKSRSLKSFHLMFLERYNKDWN